MTRSQKEKMLAGDLYNAADPEIQADLLTTGVWLKRYNDALGQSPEQWHALLSERFAEVGPGAVIRPPFHCDYGFNIRLGAAAFLNFNCVILDVVEVTHRRGRADRPRSADLRRRPPAGSRAQRRAGLEFGRLRAHRPTCLDRGRGDHPARASRFAATMPSSVRGQRGHARAFPAGAKVVGSPARVRG